MRNNLGKLYPALSPLERFKLVALAKARGDTIEEERLINSCPRLYYTINDPAFTRLVQTGVGVCMIFLSAWWEALYKVRVADAFRKTFFEALDHIDKAYVDGANSGWQAAGQQGELLQAADVSTAELIKPDRFLELLNGKIAKLKGLQLGLEQFCQAAGLEVEHILAWCEAVDYAEGADEYLTSEVEAAQETAEEVRSLFLGLWPLEVGGE